MFNRVFYFGLVVCACSWQLPSHKRQSRGIPPPYSSTNTYKEDEAVLFVAPISFRCIFRTLFLDVLPGQVAYGKR